MLRKLKQQVAQAVNNVNSQQPQHEPLYNENDDTSPQGFLCPICMQSHTSPDQLKAHFQVHAVQQISKIGDCEISSSTSSELIGNGFDGPKEGHLETDTKEIESQLLDEKCYSAELRKELDGLHNIIAKQEELSEDEVPYFTQQLHLLQAGKALAAERMLEMEKSIKTMSRHIQQLKQEKIVLIKKIGELSKDYAGKINEVEEKNQEKTLLGDELVRYRQEMQNLEAQTEILQTKLDQSFIFIYDLIRLSHLRPSEDDVSVLRKELVHAQQLMDTITQKKESEIKKYIDTIHNTERDCKKLAYEVENLKNNVEQFKNNIITFQVRAKQFLEEFSTSANVWEEKALAANEKIDCVSSKIDSIQCIVRKYQNKISNNICDKVELTKQLENCDKAVEMMAGKEEAIKKYKEEIQQLKEHISKQQKLLEKAAATENVLKLNLKNAETKESSLMKKISEGFGAEKVMIEKMQHEKLFLERTVSELNKKLTSLKCRYEETISNQNKNWETKLSIEREAVKNLKTKLHESSLKFYSFKEENEKLMKMLEGKDETMKEMEEIIEKGKAEFHSAIEKLATMEEKAKQLINELHEKNAALFRRDERCAELEETVMTMKLEMDNLKKAKRQLECNLAQKKHDEKYIQELQSTLSECEKDKIALNESIEALKQRYLKLDVDCARYRDCVVAMEKNLSEKETIMKELKTSLEVSEHFTDVAANYNKQLSVELKAQKEMFSELNEELSMKKKDFSEVTKKMEHLREQLLLEKEEKSALEDEISKLNKHNLKLQEELSIQEKKTSDMQNSFEKELSFLKHSLQECKKKEEGTLSLLNTQLKEEEDKLKNALKDVEMKDADLERMKKDLANITKECDELRIHQSELEKATAEWLQERRALQERCISAESDLEFERERAAVNKKNFDDIQTAVRELGRVNQNLQMDFAKQASRKWLDDSEARNCHACNKPFTLTNRKHHCRECGQIFCSSCSSFSAKIASHKNPVRVCSACYEEITHRN
ncbi:unnamed protein product [Thelazia callipaeda]|uniref:FYVE-type domain-containing protein n=1 Tax=Thelazia callipaeda TaxID=103827 RepID=A0A0N5CZZ6_THECL|nr:unnamed protein product [Thelazia callipaeda]